jgi:O-antigen ligase
MSRLSNIARTACVYNNGPRRVSKISVHKSRRADGSASVASAVTPLLACLFATVLAPVLYSFTRPARTLTAIMEGRIENRIVWPVLAAIAIVIAFQNRTLVRRVGWPIHVLLLFAYLSLAGASVLWAFAPQISLTRFFQQALIVISIIVPPLYAYRCPDLLRGVFICYAIGGILNLFFVVNNPPELISFYGGYSGYFEGKNYLGEFAVVMLLLALHEIRYGGARLVVAIGVAITAVTLLVFSGSKTALGLALLMPPLATVTLIAARKMRLSPATLLLAIPIGYIVLSTITGIGTNRISYMIYGDSSFTGRTVIWEFAKYEISQKPLLGWGYQSFWLSGPTAPSILEAPGWVKEMPNAHNGYYDVLLETGYVGLSILLCFMFAILRAIGRIANSDPIRAWSLLSLALYVIFYNFMESLWFRGFEFLWILFLLIGAEAVRFAQVMDRGQTSPWIEGGGHERRIGRGRLREAGTR